MQRATASQFWLAESQRSIALRSDIAFSEAAGETLVIGKLVKLVLSVIELG